MYEVETLIVAIIAACLGGIGTLYYLGKLLYDHYTMPKFRAFYPDGSTKLNCRLGEEQRRICLSIENYGRRGVRVDSVFYYFPQSFKTEKIFHFKEYKVEGIKMGAGIFDGYQYLASGNYGPATLYFSPEEKHEVCFDVGLPKKGGLYSIFISVFPTNLKAFVLELKLALV